MQKKFLPRLFIGLLALSLFSLFSVSTFAQATTDGNVITVTKNHTQANLSEISNFNAPAGNQRLLVVVFTAASSGSAANPSSVNFGGTSLVKAGEFNTFNSTAGSIWYLPLGDGAAEMNNITIAGNTGGSQVLSAFTLQSVNQTSPIGLTNMIDAFGSSSGNPTTISLNGVSSGSLVVDALAHFNDTPPSSAGTGQMVISSNVLSYDGFTNGAHASSFKLITTDGNTDMSWNWANNENPGRIAVEFKMAVAAPPAVAASNPIPTMSEWGLLIFGLLMLNLGVFFVYKTEIA